MSIHWPLSIMLILCSLWPHPLKSIRLCRIKILLLPYLILAETLLAITKIVKFLLLHIIIILSLLIESMIVSLVLIEGLGICNKLIVIILDILLSVRERSASK